ncbi:MAG: hypothetical protein R2715_08615 [Ilumatobacteraceae bacterium]
MKRLHAVLSERLEGFSPGESALESRISRLIVAHGFPPPVSQFRITTAGGRYRLDFAYPEVRTFLEGDGFGFHRFAGDLDRDSQRQNDLVVEGWRPLRFTWRMSDDQIVHTLDGLYDRAAGRWRDQPFGRPGAAGMPGRPNRYRAGGDG